MNHRHFWLPAALALMMILSGCTAGSPESSEPDSSVDSVSGATQKEESQPADTADAASSASLYFYEQSSLTGEELRTAMRNAEGSCSVATVNADGSPNLANFVPYPAGEEYLAFTFSANVTKENLLRTGEAMVSYYIYDADAEDKYERNQGARFRVEPVTDEAVIAQLREETPEIPEGSTFVHIVEVLPLG